MNATVTAINGDTDLAEFEQIVDPVDVDYEMSPAVYQSDRLDIDPESLTWAEWQAHGHRLRRVESSHQWWWGDWLKFGEQRFGEIVYGIVEDFSDTTIMQWVRVAIAIPAPDRRVDVLSFSHHKEAAGLPSLPLRRKALKWAADNQASTRELAAYCKTLNPKDEGDSGESTPATWHTWRISFKLPAALETVGDDIQDDLIDFLNGQASERGLYEELKLEHAKS